MTVARASTDKAHPLQKDRDDRYQDSTLGTVTHTIIKDMMPPNSRLILPVCFNASELVPPVALNLFRAALGRADLNAALIVPYNS